MGTTSDRLGSDGELGIVLQIIPGAVLLGQDQTTETLTLHAFDSNGDEIVVDTLAIEWMSSDSDIVSVVPDPDDAATATVTALKPTGTAMVTARLKSEPRVVTPLVTVTRAKLHPDVDLVADDDVIFPPPNLPDGMELSASQLPGVTLAGPGEEAQFGGFSESELANLFEVTDDFEVQYPIVLRGGAPSVGQRLLASGGAVIAGVVLSAEQRGDFSLVQLRVAAPQELFEELDFEMSAEKLVKDGLLMPFDTSGLDADNTNVRSGSAGRPGIAVKMASPLPQTVKEEFTIDPFKCTARIRPTFTIPRLSDDYFGPIWEPKLVIRSYKVEEFNIKVGMAARASFGPEIVLKSGASIRVSCESEGQHRRTRIIPVSGPLALFLAPYFEGPIVWILIVGNYQGGAGTTSRYGAELTFDYAYWAGGTYTPEDGWKTLCETSAECSRTSQEFELIWERDTSGNQMIIDGEVGLSGGGEVGIQAGAAIFNVVDRIPFLRTILKGRIKKLREKSKLPILKINVGPKLIVTWHNASSTAFLETSESRFHVVITGDVSLKLDALHSYLDNVLEFTGTYGSIPLVNFLEYYWVDPYPVLNEETLFVFVNGKAASQALVEVGDTVRVVANVQRKFVPLTGFQVLDTLLSGDSSTSYHQGVPHRGEIWVNRESIANMTVEKEFTLTGSFQVTQELCDLTTGVFFSSPVEVKLLAFNRMYNKFDTPNFVGSFELLCATHSKIQVTIKETITDATPVQLALIETRDGTGDISSTAELTMYLDETKEVSGWVKGEGRVEEKVGCRDSTLEESYDLDEATVSYELTYHAEVFGTHDPDNNFSIKFQPFVSYTAKVIKPYTHDRCKSFNRQLEWEVFEDLGNDGIISGTFFDDTVTLRTDWAYRGWHIKGEGQGVAPGR